MKQRGTGHGECRPGVLFGAVYTQREHIACLHPAEVPTIDHLARAC
ncbi:MAG: hypothetical protein GX463_09125 [Methanothrix sp.]|nr:hypothetical protein [Methanothrix sp.]